jgi:hypothetical protein
MVFSWNPILIGDRPQLAKKLLDMFLIARQGWISASISAMSPLLIAGTQDLRWNLITLPDLWGEAKSPLTCEFDLSPPIDPFSEFCD